MAVQLQLNPPRIRSRDRLTLYAGYAFGWPNCLGTARPYVRGCLTTPRYAHRVSKEVDTPVMLDNGAWSDHQNKRHRLLMEVVDDLIDAYHTIGPDNVRWVVAPDKVGNGYLSDRRGYEGTQWLSAKGVPGSKILWPIQEGMSLANPVRFLEFGRIGGFFIGGRTRRWKLEMARAIKGWRSDVYVHVARISSAVHLECATSIGVDSFDTTTYSRQQNWNRRQDFAETLEPYCRLSNDAWISRVAYY